MVAAQSWSPQLALKTYLAITQTDFKELRDPMRDEDPVDEFGNPIWRDFHWWVSIMAGNFERNMKEALTGRFRVLDHYSWFAWYRIREISYRVARSMARYCTSLGQDPAWQRYVAKWDPLDTGKEEWIEMTKLDALDDPELCSISRRLQAAFNACVLGECAEVFREVERRLASRGIT